MTNPGQQDLRRDRPVPRSGAERPGGAPPGGTENPPGPVAEPLEGRLLLSANPLDTQPAAGEIDWAGTWTVSGYDMSAATGYTGAGADQHPDSAQVTITPLGDGSYRVDPGDADYAVTATRDDAGGLSGRKSGYETNGDYYESYLRIMPLGHGKALLLYAEGSSSSPGNWQANAFAGLAVRGQWTPTPRPWQGEYDVAEYTVDIHQDAAGNLAAEAGGGDRAVRIASIAHDQYGMWDLDDLDAPAPAFLDWQGRLLRNTADYDTSGNYVQWYQAVYRGPDDTLYWFGHDSTFDGPMRRDLWDASFYVAAATPRASYQWVADLTAALDERHLPDVTFPGESFNATVRVANANFGPAVGRIRLALYASADETLDDGDFLVGQEDVNIQLARNQGRTWTLTALPTASMPYGSYHLIAVADADDAVGETDETNNVAVSAGTFQLAEPILDLSGEFAGVSLGRTVVPGDQGTARLTVTNAGNVRAAGRVDIRFYLSADETLDDGDTMIGSLAGRSLRLDAGRGRTYTARLAVPADLPSGTYRLLAEVDASDDFHEADETNNVVAWAAPMELAWKFGDLGDRRAVRLTVRDAAGTAVTLALTGGGYGEVVGGRDLQRIELHETTRRSRMRITTPRAAAATVGDIVIDGDLSYLYAPAVTLTGDLTAERSIRKLTLGGLAGGSRIEIDPAGRLVEPDHAITLSLGLVRDASIDTNDVPIGSLTVLDWRDTDGRPDRIDAPWIGRLTVRGRRSRDAARRLNGDFQAELHLTGRMLRPGRYVLRTASIAGRIDSPWDIRGAIGTIRAAAADETWTLRAAGPVGAIDARDALAGDVEAWYFRRLSTRGPLTARISASACDERTGVSIGSLAAGAVRDVSLDLPGGVSSIDVLEWVDTDGAADRLRAGWLGRLTVRGRRGGHRQSALAGDFQPALVLTGQGLIRGRYALGSARIAGSVAAAEWSIAGSASAVRISGSLAGWTASFARLRQLVAGDVADANLHVADALGAVKVYRWLGGGIEAGSIGSLYATGHGGAIPGDFTASLEVGSQQDPDAAGDVAAARINGDLADAIWHIAGDLRSLYVRGEVRETTVRTAGSIGRCVMTAVSGSHFLAGIDDSVADRPTEANQFADTDAAIGSLVVRGRHIRRSDPTRFVIDSTFSAATIRSARLINTNSADTCGLYALATPRTGLRAVRYVDTYNGVRWSWRGPGGAAIFGDFTLGSIHP
ncbi:MAG: hypothetical protein J7M21_02500 [Planctomycetes bacterium]|nr:hypothetical protein [Planctomycetota bacterium]